MKIRLIYEIGCMADELTLGFDKLSQRKLILRIQAIVVLKG